MSATMDEDVSRSVDDMGSPGPLREPPWELNAKARQTRALILNQARQLFLERGYAGTSIDHIARACGLSRGALYTYFGSKFEVFLTLGTSTYKQSVAVIKRFSDVPKPATLAGVRDWVQEYFDFMDAEGALMLASGPDVPTEPWFREQIVVITTRNAERLGSAIRSHSSRRDVSPETLGIVAMSMLERSWYFLHGLQLELDETHVIDEVSQVLLGLMQPERRTS